jgi:hypothetical protein
MIVACSLELHRSISASCPPTAGKGTGNARRRLPVAQFGVDRGDDVRLLNPDSAGVPCRPLLLRERGAARRLRPRLFQPFADHGGVGVDAHEP